MPGLHGARRQPVSAGDDDRVVQSAAFGLTHVDMAQPKRARRGGLRRWFGSAKNTVSPGAGVASSIDNRFTLLLQRLVFYDTVVAMLAIPFRIGFVFDPYNEAPYRHQWTALLGVLTALDAWSMVLKVLPFVVRKVAASSRLGSDSKAVSNVTTFRMLSKMPSKIMPEEEPSRQGQVIRDIDAPQSNGDDREARRYAEGSKVESPTRRWPMITRAILLIPWGIALCLCGQCNLSHVGGVVRLVQSLHSLSSHFSKGVLSQFRSTPFVRSLSFSTTSLVFHVSWTGLYLCHLVAAGYMLIARVECGFEFSSCLKSPIPGCWVLKDELEHGSLWRKYARTMYWAAKTVTTLGQGDLVPTTIVETNYCICVQFISGLWATACLSACGFAFSRRDANIRHSFTTQFDESLQFVRARRLSAETSDAVITYFRHMLRTRGCVDEASVFAGLPVRYRSQCSHQIKQGLLKRVPILRKQEGAFLRALLDALEEDFFSPNQVIVDFGDAEELFIVSSGEVRVSNAENTVVRRLLPGNCYADSALVSATKSEHRLVAESPSELWWLPRKVFEDAVAIFLPQPKRAVILGQYLGPQGSSSAHVRPGEPKDLALRKLMDKVDRDTANSVKSVARWRLPTSSFRTHWRFVECCCLLFVGFEVPIHIAFHHDFGVVNSLTAHSAGVRTLQLIGFYASFMVECFFALNWYFCAYVFVRRTQGGDGIGNRRSSTEEGQANGYDLIVESKQIFRHYLENDDLLFDILGNIPFSLLWDIIPKSSLTRRVTLSVSSVRLLRLLRLRFLEPTMKLVMSKRDVSPATQLLWLNSVGCALLANLAACIYFLAGDFFHDVQHDSTTTTVGLRHSVTSASCLADSSVFGNCSWLIFDHSEFGINAVYVRSMHWSLVLLSTVGYGDILAFSDGECLIGFFWIYAGAIICYSTACAISSVLSHWNVLIAIKNDRLETVNRTLLSFKSLSPSTVRIVQRYYVNTWKMNGIAITETELLARLPKSLREGIARELYGGVNRCKLFSLIDKSLPGAFVNELASKMYSEVFLAGVDIMRQELTADEAFVVQHGAVELFTEPARVKSYHPPGQRTRASPFQTPQQLIGTYGYLTAGDVTYVSLSPPLSVAVLRRDDIFGEEAFSYPEVSCYILSARTLVSTQLAVIRRQTLLDLVDRHRQEVEQLASVVDAKARKERHQVRLIRRNFRESRKLARLFGRTRNLRARAEDTQAIERNIIRPGDIVARIWVAIVSSILTYNFYVIVFRLAFLPQPSAKRSGVLNNIDYAFDAVLWVDMFLKWNHLGYTDPGMGEVLDRGLIRKHYEQGWLKWDIVSMIPLYFPTNPSKMAFARLPRLIRTPQIMATLHSVEDMVQERYLRGGTVFLSIFDMAKFLVFFLSAAHYLGSFYYLLGRLQMEYGLVESSWITADTVLPDYPHQVEVHYIRSLYWCLETFTVVCFGDVIARNVAETLFASATCLLGWIFIGQIIGRMTSLVLNVDKEANAHAVRVNDFEEYAKRRSLPPNVRERAKESAEYKSKVMLELQATQLFRELPKVLRMTIFDEAYGIFLRRISEFDSLTWAQVQSLASVLTLEIYMKDDIIFTEGRVATRLCIMKEGRGELFSPTSSIVLAGIHEGVMFGDCAFFIPGAKHLASARAHTSCQVLQLERDSWKTLWPDRVRRDTEERLTRVMREKYRATMKSYINVVKNFELSKNTCSQRSVPIHRKRTPRILMLSEKGKLERLLLESFFVRSPAKSRSPIRSTLLRMNTLVRAVWERFDGGFQGLQAREHSSRPGSPAQNLSRLRTAATKVNAARPDKETMWSRHSKRLRVLRMLDDKIGDAEIGLGDVSTQQTASTSLRVRSIASRRKSAGPWVTSGEFAKVMQPNTIGTSSQNVSTNSSRSSCEETNTPFRRHSIQLTSEDILSKFLALHSLPGKDGAQSQNQVTTILPANGSPQFLALRNRGPKHIGSLQKGNSSRSVMMSNTPQRKRSNSFQMMLINGNASGVRRQVSLYAKALGDVFNNAFKSHRQTTHLYGIWCEPPRPPSFVLEGSGFRRIWDTVMLWICLYFVLVIPFRASFNYEYLMLADANTSVQAWFSIEYVMDAVCLCDFILRKNYFTFVHRGQIVTSSKAIRDHYFRHGTYVFDMMSLVPLELLAPLLPLFIPGITKVTWYHIAVLRLNKNIRIVHLHDLSERVQQMMVYDFKLTLARRSILYWIRFTFDFVLGAHIVACFAYAIAFNTLREDGRKSWLKSPGMLTFSGCDGLQCIGEIPVSERYARAYHFSMGAITTVSYGDIAPQNAWETLVTAIVIVASIVLFGMLSGGFFQFFEMEVGRRADYEHRVANVAQYMQLHRLNPKMWKQMQVYFAVHWAESKGMNEEGLLRGLTTTVKQDIAFFVMEDLVRNMRLFANAEPAFARAMVSAFQQELFVRNDIIICEGDTERSLYVIESGLVSVRITKKTTLEQIEIIKGRYEFVGEKSLIFNIPRTATCVALCSCSVLILTLDRYEKILHEFPDYREKNAREWMFTRGGARQRGGAATPRGVP